VAKSKRPSSQKTSSGNAKTSSLRGTLTSKSNGLKDESRHTRLAHLESVLDLMGKHEIAELEWENKGERLKLKTRHAIAYASGVEAGLGHAPPYGFSNRGGFTLERETDFEGKAQPSSLSSPALSPTASSAVSSVVSVVSNDKQVLSPFVGTFYRSASPESDPYTREGQLVKRGDVLCIIEAMKLMNEIDAEFPGKIKSVLVENGQPVEFGEPLFIIEV
jgi:acetyl-CoA carboxylase biotin carboxyl carrier protein